MKIQKTILAAVLLVGSLQAFSYVQIKKGYLHNNSILPLCADYSGDDSDGYECKKSHQLATDVEIKNHAQKISANKTLVLDNTKRLDNAVKNTYNKLNNKIDKKISEIEKTVKTELQNIPKEVLVQEQINIITEAVTLELEKKYKDKINELENRLRNLEN